MPLASDNLARQSSDQALPITIQIVARTPSRSSRYTPREQPAYSAEMVRYADCQRSAAVQAALLANPRKAKEATAVLLLAGFRRDVGMKLRLHDCHRVAAVERNQPSHRTIHDVLAGIIRRLGFSEDGEGCLSDGLARLTNEPDVFVIYEAVRGLPEQDVEHLLTMLPILCLGQAPFEGADTGESLLNRIAMDLGLAMRVWWTPDVRFLELLTREQLLQVAEESGARATFKGMNGWTKRRLVEELAAHFAKPADPEKVVDQKTEWLPGLLQFPAVASVLKGKE